MHTTISFLLCLVPNVVYILNFLLYPKMFFFGFQVSVNSLSVLGDLLIILAPMEYIIPSGNVRFFGSCRPSDLVEPLLYFRIFR